jgi:hypothetical protein
VRGELRKVLPGIDAIKLRFGRNVSGQIFNLSIADKLSSNNYR